MVGGNFAPKFKIITPKLRKKPTVIVFESLA